MSLLTTGGLPTVISTTEFGPSPKLWTSHQSCGRGSVPRQHLTQVVRAILTAVLGRIVPDLHTKFCLDFNIAGGLTSASQVLANWENIISNATQLSTGFIVLEHDLFQQSVEIATGYILPAALANQPPLNIQPIVTCLHKPMNDAYIETNDNKTNPPVVSGTCLRAASDSFSDWIPPPFYVSTPLLSSPA